MTEILDSGQRKTSFKMEKVNYPVSSHPTYAQNQNPDKKHR